MYGCLEQEKKPLTLEEVASLVKHHVADHHWKQVLLLPPDIPSSLAVTVPFPSVFVSILKRTSVFTTLEAFVSSGTDGVFLAVIEA